MTAFVRLKAVINEDEAASERFERHGKNEEPTANERELERKKREEREAAATKEQKIFLGDFENKGKTALIIMQEEGDVTEMVQMADIMRRGGINVVIASLEGSRCVRGSNRLLFCTDNTLSDELKNPPHDVLVMPGGLLGAKSLIESEVVGDLLTRYDREKRLIVAIGDAPPVLRKNFIGAGKTVTCHPMIKHKMEGSEYLKYKYIDDDVIVDGKIVTCKGGPHTMQCALNVLHLVCGRYVAETVGKKLLVDYDDGFCRECCGNCKYCCRADKREVAERFMDLTCSCAEDPNVLKWEEERLAREAQQLEDKIYYKIRRIEMKAEKEERRKQQEELECSAREDSKWMEERRRSLKDRCVTEHEHQEFVNLLAMAEETRYNEQAQRKNDKLYRKIARAKKRREMIQQLKHCDPEDLDTLLEAMMLKNDEDVQAGMERDDST